MEYIGNTVHSLGGELSGKSSDLRTAPVARNRWSITHQKRGAFDDAKNHKRQRRKRQSVTAKREK